MISNERKKFLKKIRYNNLFIKITQLLILIFFLIIWQVIVDKKLVNSFISSSPLLIYKTLINLFKQKILFNNILITIYETLLSFFISMILGTFIATILWLNKTLAKIVDPFLTFLNSLPKVALGPIIIIWCGANINSIILMALFISTIITILNIYNSFISVDKGKIKLLKSFNASKFFIFKRLIIPSSIPVIISTLKINISMSLIGVIMGEFLVSKSGIGYLIIYGSQVFNLNLVMTGIFILGFISVIMYYIVLFIEKKLIKYIHYL